MRSKPPGSKSGTVQEDDDWDTVIIGTSKLADNYGECTIHYTMLVTMLCTMTVHFPPQIKKIFDDGLRVVNTILV